MSKILTLHHNSASSFIHCKSYLKGEPSFCDHVLYTASIDICSRRLTSWEGFPTLTLSSYWGIVGRTKNCFLCMNTCQKEAWKTIYSEVSFEVIDCWLIVLWSEMLGSFIFICRRYLHGTNKLEQADEHSIGSCSWPSFPA